MVDWAVHKKWDTILGISDSASNYVLHAIDCKGPFDKIIELPEDFKKHTLDRKLPVAGHKHISISDLKSNLHDRYRDKIIQKEDLQFLVPKGQEYVKAYYLHILLDYLKHQDFWITQTGEIFSASVAKCIKHKCVSLPHTHAILGDVQAFLEAHRQEIEHDLNLD